MKKLLSLFCACVLLWLCACQSQPAASESDIVDEIFSRTALTSAEAQFSACLPETPLAVLTTSAGTFYVVLYPQYAPLAVKNFTTLAQQGYYNNTQFHRVVHGFIVQGGDATNTGTGGDTFWGQPFHTEHTPKLHHYAGALCTAAPAGTQDQNTSQFYLVTTPPAALSESALTQLLAAGYTQSVVDTYRQAGGAPYLDFTDTVFGQVYAGMDVVDTIAATPTDENERPKQPITIHSILISDARTTQMPGVPAPVAPPVSLPPISLPPPPASQPESASSASVPSE